MDSKNLDPNFDLNPMQLQFFFNLGQGRLHCLSLIDADNVAQHWRFLPPSPSAQGVFLPAGGRGGGSEGGANSVNCLRVPQVQMGLGTALF